MFKSIKESLLNIMPVVIIVSLLDCVLHFSTELMITFYISAILIAVGVSLFTFGADISMFDIGHELGEQLIKSKKLILILLTTFIVGVVLTIAEPDLIVFSKQLTSIPSMTIIIVSSIGVGIFLLISTISTLYNFDTSNLFIIFYTAVLALLVFVPNSFIATAFDAGGVTTGAITVPFVMALGLGLTTNRTDNSSKDNSFGSIGLCSIGPILTVLLLGLFFGTKSEYISTSYEFSGNILSSLTNGFWECLKSTCVSLIPIIFVFIVFELVTKAIRRERLRKVLLGMFATLLGLTLFLTGVETGFVNIGYLIGNNLVLTDYKLLLVVIGMLVGCFAVYTEPAVNVFTTQVEKTTEGSISKKLVLLCLAIGTAFAVGISLYRAISGIPITYFLIPGYTIVIALALFVPKLFVSIAFDAGGAIVGPMTASFILPITIGACLASGGNVLIDAFGVVALVELTPLITIQLLGLVYKYKKDSDYEHLDVTGKIVEYNWEG